MITIGWVVLIAVLFVVVFRLVEPRNPQWPMVRLQDGSRLRVTSSAYAKEANLTAPPHKMIGPWRSGPAHSHTVSAESGFSEFLVMFEREQLRLGKSIVANSKVDRLVILDAHDEVVCVGQFLAGFGSLGPLWETSNEAISFGSLTNQSPILRIAMQVQEGSQWKTLGILSITNPATLAAPTNAAPR